MHSADQVSFTFGAFDGSIYSSTQKLLTAVPPWFLTTTSIAAGAFASTYPALSLANVGRSSKVDTLRVEGRINRADQSMQLRLSNASTANAADALEIRIHDGVAEGRGKAATGKRSTTWPMSLHPPAPC